MTYPFDQLTALADANQKLALSFASVMRAAGERQAKIASRSFSTLSAASGDSKSAAHAFGAFSTLPQIAAETEENRQAAFAEGKRALGEWRESVTAVFSPDEAQVEASLALESWSRLARLPFAWVNAAAAQSAPAAEKTVGSAAV